MDFSFLAEPGAMAALGKVVMIDLTLAADNAIIIGALAAGLPAGDRHKVIALGMVAALVMRIAFAIVVVHLLDIVGIRLAGGLLLLWVCWKMYRELRPGPGVAVHHGAHDSALVDPNVPPARTMWGAAWAVAVADLSMSLDNVLAVAGASQHHTEVMVIGLVLSVVLMGLAANVVARLIGRYQWIGWIGLLLILYVAIEMIIGGGTEVLPIVEPIVNDLTNGQISSLMARF